jgi:uncharacterized membrane protein YkoI
MKRKLTAVTAATLLALSLAALASDDDARMLREAGDIKPLVEIINENPELRDARILEADLEHERGRYVYEIEYLDDSGTHRESYIDAETGEVLKREHGH